MFTVTGSPIVAFVDAVKASLTGDATLAALVTGVYGAMPRAARTAYPILVIGRRTYDGAGGAMQLAGGNVMAQVDVWSQKNGPFEAANILSRVRAVLERRTLNVMGFSMIGGSMHCELEEVFDEPDEDAPEQMLFHGVQQWTAQVEERI